MFGCPGVGLVGVSASWGPVNHGFVGISSSRKVSSSRAQMQMGSRRSGSILDDMKEVS